MVAGSSVPVTRGAEILKDFTLIDHVVDGARYAVGPGDVAYIPPDAVHSVVNESEEELLWAAYWWRIMDEPAK